MYTIYVTSDNELQTTIKQRIMQQSKLVDKLHFLLAPIYESGGDRYDMRDFSCTMKYLLPVSKEYRTETLTYSDELYETESGVEMLECLLPFDTGLTREWGDIELYLTFVKVEMDAEGKTYQYVRNTDKCTISIIPLANWAAVVPDAALNIIDQKLVEVQTKINELNDISETLNMNKADNIKIDDEKEELYLTAEGEQIGDPISIPDLAQTLVEDDEPGMVKVVL